MLFEESLKFEGGRDEVWKRVSAVREIPNYWHGTKSLEVVSEGQNAVHAKLKFAFGGSGEADILTDDGTTTVTIRYTSGPFTGEQAITVSDGEVRARWDIRFMGVFRLAARWNEGHFRSGTRHALERLTGREPTSSG
jgi:hypothetical protein